MTTPATATCPRCEGVGFWIDDGNTTRRCDCGAAEENHAALLRPHSRIPAALWDSCSLKMYHAPTEAHRAALQAATGWLSAHNAGAAATGLMLVGGTGAGKTHLLMGMCRALVRRGVPCVWWEWPDYLAAARRCINDPATPDPFDSIRDARVIALDDIGAAGDNGVSEFRVERLLEVLNHAMHSGKRVLASSNLQGAALERREGDRAASRLRGLCGAPVVVQVPDWRVRL